MTLRDGWDQEVAFYIHRLKQGGAEKGSSTEERCPGFSKPIWRNICRIKCIHLPKPLPGKLKSSGSLPFVLKPTDDREVENVGNCISRIIHSIKHDDINEADDREPGNCFSSFTTGLELVLHLENCNSQLSAAAEGRTSNCWRWVWTIMHTEKSKTGNGTLTADDKETRSANVHTQKRVCVIKS